MKNLKSKSYKLLSLKENIRMRVLFLGWEDLITHWSKNGRAFTLEELSLHLKMIVSKQRSQSIPNKSPVLLPVGNSLPQHVTKAPDIVAMGADHLETSDEFEQQTRSTGLERKAVSVGDKYSNIQPTLETAIYKELIGKWMYACLQYSLDDVITELLWSQA